MPAGWTSAHPRADRAHDLADRLRGQILAGKLAVGARLDEAVLVRDFEASRNTVREALQLLSQQGLIDRKRGAGTTVASAKYGHGLDRLAGLAETLAGYGTVRNRVLVAESIARLPDQVAAQLEIDPTAGGVRLERLRFINDEPLSYDVSYLTYEVGEPLLAADLAGSDVFALIEQTTGTRLGRAEITVHAAVAEPHVAELLDLPDGAAIFTIERLTRLDDGMAVDSEVLQIRADRFALQAVVHRDHRADPL
ncbi:GntR family transcriptional regulator [Microlunatus elymi]|uniref:GntR family transcriptional regulator n=1 Tax=Microlunatus elymi TaxID=2596828 RepID=A0A516Q789_9ACTN|nr:GntR family transcriptional regulator [Microlunatus elymi]